MITNTSFIMSHIIYHLSKYRLTFLKRHMEAWIKYTICTL